MWQDIFFTVVVAYVLFRVLGEYSHRKQQDAPRNEYPPAKKNTNDDNEGEYIDYEEIK